MCWIFFVSSCFDFLSSFICTKTFSARKSGMSDTATSSSSQGEEKKKDDSKGQKLVKTGQPGMKKVVKRIASMSPGIRSGRHLSPSGKDDRIRPPAPSDSSLLDVDWNSLCECPFFSCSSFSV